MFRTKVIITGRRVRDLVITWVWLPHVCRRARVILYLLGLGFLLELVKLIARP